MFLKKSPCTFKLHSQRGKIYPREKFYPNKHSHIHISISIDLILLILINSNARSLVHFFHFFQTSQLYKNMAERCNFLLHLRIFFFCTKLCWFSSQE